MKTRLIQAYVQPVRPGSDNSAPSIDNAAIAEAATLLSRGDVVAIPTETVYGLAANALDANAVKKIYEAKGRPANNPLIVHVHSVEQAKTLVTEWPESAEVLASAFWPGPLTLILRKKPGLVPDITTAAGDTVALRCPRHTVALEVIRQCGFPLAAPSANRSNALSPTTASHVEESLGERIPLILDGGACIAGIESTVLDLTSKMPRVLRPGVLTANFLAEVLQCKVEQPQLGLTKDDDNKTRLSPGQMTTHYAPKTLLYLVKRKDMARAIAHFGGVDKVVAVVSMSNPDVEDHHGTTKADEVIKVVMPDSPDSYAQYLYATFHELDSHKPDVIICELPPKSQEWLAVNDRLSRAGRSWP